MMNDMLVIARKRAFWETDIFLKHFPNNLLLPSKVSAFQEIFYFLRVILIIFFRNPRVIIFGTTTRLTKWIGRLKRSGFFSNNKFITDNQQLLNHELLAFEKIIVYSEEEIKPRPEREKHRFIFLHYPSKRELVDPIKPIEGDYVFCGGSNKRDHASFIEALRGTSYKGIIVTDQKLPDNIPDNIKVHGRIPLFDYLKMMAESKFVCVPLQESFLPHGHCDISCAFSFGKPVVSTYKASVDPYIENGIDGVLVNPKDIDGYRTTFQKIFDDEVFYKKLKKEAEEKADNFSYDAFISKLETVVKTLSSSK